LSAKFYLNNSPAFSGRGFTGDGFINSSGRIISERARAFDYGGAPNVIHIENYDATGDLMISNCTATLVPPSK
jgi:hypothetical protein